LRNCMRAHHETRLQRLHGPRGTRQNLSHWYRGRCCGRR
jgi:hypothetical protein